MTKRKPPQKNRSRVRLYQGLGVLHVRDLVKSCFRCVAPRWQNCLNNRRSLTSASAICGECGEFVGLLVDENVSRVGQNSGDWILRREPRAKRVP